MDAMVLFGKWIARMMDFPLGWLLLLPRDLAIVFVALATSVILTVARRLTTDQDLMRRCKEDLDRLNVLTKQAKANKDKPTLKRIQTTVGMIQMTKMKAEGWGLLASLLPIILLASWAFERLDFFPPAVGETVTVRATFPAAAQGQPAWLIPPPADRLECLDSPVQIIRKDDNIDPLTHEKLESIADNGLAVWRLKVVGPCDPELLRIHFDRKAIECPLRAGGRIYADPIIAHDTAAAWPDATSQVVLRQSWPLEWVPGGQTFWKWWLHAANDAAPKTQPGLPNTLKMYFWSLPIWLVTRVTLFAPWLAGYLLLTIPFVPLLRRVARVY